jgi:3-hydroxyacyl-[acyl-carrier-protein] dehydratase
VATFNNNEAELENLKQSLRRCSPETVEAAIEYRKSNNPQFVAAIVTGIIERFLEPDLKPLMRKGDDSLRLFDDLGVDSLTMMEIVILVEEIIGISVENEELRNLRSIADIKQFIQSKLTIA